MEDVYLIVGLGNPGRQYEQTRHNIGFMVIEALQDELGWAEKPEGKFAGMLAKGKHQGKTLLLLKPTTYMNRSGESVRKVMDFYKIPPVQILVVYDDIDLPFGKVRFRKDGSAGTHNGMKSLIACLGNPGFGRLRVGVSAPPPEWDLADYVLAPFHPQTEQPQLKTLIQGCTRAIHTWLAFDMQTAMNQWNAPWLLPQDETPTQF